MALLALLIAACMLLQMNKAYGRSADLIDAARNNNVERIKALIAEGADVDAADENGRTALLIATHRNSIDAAAVLIGAGADVNRKDDIEDSPFLYAGAEGRLEILRLMLKAGADLASTNRYGGTALIPAAHHGHVETVRELLRTKIDIDHINKLGWTALLEAVILGDGSSTYVEIVRLLVDAGADMTIADRDGVTPLAHAVARRQDAVEKLLREKGAVK